VSVKRTLADERIFIVRRLDPGQSLPVGTSEALLVFDDPDAAH
jgi:hypothetical protein